MLCRAVLVVVADLVFGDVISVRYLSMIVNTASVACLHSCSLCTSISLHILVLILSDVGEPAPGDPGSVPLSRPSRV